MKISYIKCKKDKQSFKLFERIGLDIYEIEDLEQTDNKIKELVLNKYNTIVITNELASFSEDIIKKYSKKEGINIIIAPEKRKDNNVRY